MGRVLSDYEVENQTRGVRDADGEPFETPKDIRVDGMQPPRPVYASNGRPQKGDTVNPYAPYAFALRRGKSSGKSNIYNGRLFITVARKNGEDDYESETPVPYYPSNMTAEADYETTELDFNGDVWVCWGDVEDGVPGYVEVRSSDSGDFNVKVGSIADPIQQEVHGDIHWVWFETGSSSSDGSDNASGSSLNSSSGPGNGQSSAIGSSKDTAVVPGPNGAYVKWHAMESAEVLFFDFQEFKVGHGVTRVPIDPIVLFGIERQTARVFGSPNIGNAYVTVEGEEIVIRSRFSKRIERQTVQVMLKATRRGFAGVRNGHATFDDMVDNECRLNPRITREQVIKALDSKGINQ